MTCRLTIPKHIDVDPYIPSDYQLTLSHLDLNVGLKQIKNRLSFLFVTELTGETIESHNTFVTIL